MDDGLPPDEEIRSDSSVRVVDNNRFTAHEDDFKGANDEAYAIRLATLEEEHRDLDSAIQALEQSSTYERLSIARLKKKKLHLKDEIRELKNSMLPDIIA